MAFRALCFLALAAAASGLTVASSRVTCHPKTQVCLSTSKDAVGEPIWGCEKPTHGALVDMPKGIKEVKICGFGTFKFSPMTCDGGRFDYKADSFPVPDGKGECHVQALTYESSCYEVDCSRGEAKEAQEEQGEF